MVIRTWPVFMIVWESDELVGHGTYFYAKIATLSFSRGSIVIGNVSHPADCAFKTQVGQMFLIICCRTVTKMERFWRTEDRVWVVFIKTHWRTKVTTFWPKEWRNQANDTVNHIYVKWANYPESLTFVGQRSDIDIQFRRSWVVFIWGSGIVWESDYWLVLRIEKKCTGMS